MFICGIDYSISSPAVVKAELDDNFDIVSVDYISFTSTLKNCKLDERLEHNAKKNFRNDMDRFYFLRDKVESFMYGNNTPDYVSIEGYAMGGMGKVFNIAEATVMVKAVVYDHGTPLRIYTPSMIKKYAADNGTAGKVSMFEAFNVLDDVKPYLSHLQDLKNPQEDLIDAYWIMKLLQMELKLRHGIIQLRELKPKQIEVFNAVSKSQPQNVLVRDFLQKI